MAELEDCVLAFLRFIKNEPVLKSAFITFANGLIVDIDASLARIQLTLVRLDIYGQVLNVFVGAIEEIVNKLRFS